MQPLTTGNSLIDRHGLAEEVLSLKNQGKTLREIAEALCGFPKMREAGLTISHSAVGEWLKRETEEQRELMRSVVTEKIGEKVAADLGVLDFLVDDLVKEYQSSYESVEDLGIFGEIRKNVPLPFERKVQIANSLRQLVSDRLKLAGLNQDSGGAFENFGDLLKEARERVDAAEAERND